MKIQHTLFSLIGLFASNVLLAQNWEKSINIYNQTTFYETTVFQGTTGQNGSIATESTHKAIQYLKPTIAIQWKSKENKYGHQIELTTLESKKVDFEEIAQNETIAGYTSNYGSIAFRYELKRFWNLNKVKNLILELGTGAHPVFIWNISNPKTSLSFPTRYNNTSLSAMLVPGISYTLSEKCSLNLNVPLNLLSIRLTNQTVQNPSFNNNQQKTTTLDFSTLDRNMYLRLGVGIKI